MIGTEPLTYRPFDKTLGIITHVPHWVGSEGVPWAYEPYVREIKFWADLFTKVYISAPIGEGPPQRHLAPYEKKNISWIPIEYSMSNEPGAPWKRFFQLPGLIRSLAGFIRDLDFVHLRSPGHPALLGYLLIFLMKKRSLTKWAGYFGAYDGERLPSRIERWIRNFPSKQNPILIYGPSTRPHLISFNPAVMSLDELKRAQILSQDKEWQPPWKLLSVGNLIPVKGLDLAICGLGILHKERPDLKWQFTIVGDGPENANLQRITAEYGIADQISFTGFFGFQKFKDITQKPIF